MQHHRPIWFCSSSNIINKMHKEIQRHLLRLTWNLYQSYHKKSVSFLPLYLASSTLCVTVTVTLSNFSRRLPWTIIHRWSEFTSALAERQFVGRKLLQDNRRWRRRRKFTTSTSHNQKSKSIAMAVSVRYTSWSDIAQVESGGLFQYERLWNQFDNWKSNGINCTKQRRIMQQFWIPRTGWVRLTNFYPIEIFPTYTARFPGRFEPRILNDISLYVTHKQAYQSLHLNVKYNAFSNHHHAHPKINSRCTSVVAIMTVEHPMWIIVGIT